MRTLTLILLVILIVSVFVVDGGRNNKKNKSKHQESQENEKERGTDFGNNGSKENEQKERVHTLVDRQEERKKEKDDKDSSSSEENENNKEEKSNGTEVVIPRMKRLVATVDTPKTELNLNENMVPIKYHPAGDEYEQERETNFNELEKSYVLPTDAADESSEANDDSNKRYKRSDDKTHTMKKAKELNDGEQIAIENRPKVEAKTN